MRRFTRLTSISAAVALAFSAGVSAGANPALADKNEQPINSVEAPLVDLDGSVLEPQDAGPPAGDDTNAVDVEAVAENRGSRLAIELSHALGSKDSQDMKGYEKSLYQGKWYMPAKEDRRRCIMDREANHRYRAVSAGGIYRGVYQMNRGLARGATFMMQKEVKKEMPEALAAVKRLRKIPTQQWNRYWQDRAFWTIWRKGKGAFHWRGGGWKC